MNEHYYQGNKLPHWHPPGATFFITARLFGSIPKPVIEQLKAEYQLALYEIQKEKIEPENAEKMLPAELTDAIVQSLPYAADHPQWDVCIVESFARPKKIFRPTKQPYTGSKGGFLGRRKLRSLASAGGI